MKRYLVMAFLGGLSLSFFNIQKANAQIVFGPSVPTAPSPATSFQPVPMMQIIPVSTSEEQASPEPAPAPLPILEKTPAHGYICEELGQCTLIAPTVLVPKPTAKLMPDKKFVIAGVSYNNTKVEVYIDDTYAGQATLRNDASGVGDFYFHSASSLTPGDHSAYAITRNFRETEQSGKSGQIYFTVSSRKISVISAPSISVVDQGTEETKDEKTPKTSEPAKTEPMTEPILEATSSANNILQNFFGAENNNTSTASTTPGFATKLRNILLLLIVIALVIVVIRRLRRGPNTSSAQSDSSDPKPPLDDLPPPPA